MFRLIWKSMYVRRERSFFLIVGVLIVSAAFGLLLGTIKTTKIIVDEDLAKSWRTTYDLLVRPNGTKSNVETKHNLVQANHLNLINGGITLDQYQSISNIPDVEVAAPIAMIGSFQLIFNAPLEVDCDPGFYRLENTVITQNGIESFQTSGSEYFYCDGTEKEFYHLLNSPYYNKDAVIFANSYTPNQTPWFRRTVYAIPVLLAAIDPEKEEQLLGLNSSIVQGEYLPAGIQNGVFPLIFNINNYIDFKLETTWKKLDLTLTTSMFEQISSEGGELFLKEASTQLIDQWSFSGQDAYKAALSSVNQYENQFNQLFSLPMGLSYQEIPAPNTYTGLTFQAQPIGVVPGGITIINMPLESADMETSFRKNDLNAGLGGNIKFHVYGFYDIEELRKKTEDINLPLETYFPPTFTIIYDQDGNLIPQTTISPTLQEGGYITSPPLALTNLEAASQLSAVPLAPISAIRVRVAGIENFTYESQRRIENIAAEIVEQTGLDVDITVGSSSKKVLINVPGYKNVSTGLGYGEENWIQMGVSYLIKNEINKINQVFFFIMLIVCGFYTLNTNMINALGRQKEFSLYKALGWQTKQIFQVVLMEGLGIGFIAGVLGFLLAHGLSRIFGLLMPINQSLLIIPMSLLLCFFGTLFPAIRVSRVRPALFLSRGEITPNKIYFRGLTLFVFAIQQVWQRRTRSILVISTLVVSNTLLIIFLFAVFWLNGYLKGTVLGDSVLLHIGTIQWIIIGISFMIAGLTTLDILLITLSERKWEFAVLRSVGWQKKNIVFLLLIEIVIVAVFAGVGSWALAILVLRYLNYLVPLNFSFLLIPSIFIPVIVSLFIAIYPILKVLNVPPLLLLYHD